MSPDRPWPRIYSTTIAQRAAMSIVDREILYHEYAAYWKGRERGNTHNVPSVDDARAQGVHWNGKAGGR